MSSGDRSDAAVRASAIEIILCLISSAKIWTQSLADQLVFDVLEKEKNPELRRTRYFGDSQTHRSKNRILQTLLILEPSISNVRISVVWLTVWLIQAQNQINELHALSYLQSKRKMLVKWAKDRLIHENHQPSVRYQTEWLLVRLLSTMPDELEDFWNLFCKVNLFF